MTILGRWLPLNQLLRHVINSPESYSCSNSPIPLPYLESREPVFLLLPFFFFSPPCRSTCADGVQRAHGRAHSDRMKAHSRAQTRTDAHPVHPCGSFCVSEISSVSKPTIFAFFSLPNIIPIASHASRNEIPKRDAGL